jgi:RNA polymerase sigma-70 factor (ECF subfamily)
MTADAPESDLVARARAGDHRAFSLLLANHDDQMRALAFRMLGGRAAMDDALQDAYVKAYRSLGRFQEASSFATWLHRIVARTCIDHLRKRQRRREVPLEVVSATAPDRSAAPDQLVTDRSVLGQALSELPADQRAAVVLVDGEGYSYEQAAEVLGTRPGTIASRLSRARSSLRTALGADRGEGVR